MIPNTARDIDIANDVGGKFLPQQSITSQVFVKVYEATNKVYSDQTGIYHFNSSKKISLYNSYL